MSSKLELIEQDQFRLVESTVPFDMENFGNSNWKFWSNGTRTKRRHAGAHSEQQKHLSLSFASNVNVSLEELETLK